MQKMICKVCSTISVLNEGAVGTCLSCHSTHIYPYEEDTALRYNQGKLRWSLVHFPSLEPMVEVLEYGCKKYDQDNWRKAMDKKEILESAMRHLIRLMGGHEKDEESGLPEIGHLMANLMFYAYHSRANPYEK